VAMVKSKRYFRVLSSYYISWNTTNTTYLFYQIHETSQKRRYKSIEFYDVRAAEAALYALNMRDIAGKKIKLEPCCFGDSNRYTIDHNFLVCIFSVSSYLDFLKNLIILDDFFFEHTYFALEEDVEMAQGQTTKPKSNIKPKNQQTRNTKG
jgi:hypothetical protein